MCGDTGGTQPQPPNLSIGCRPAPLCLSNSIQLVHLHCPGPLHLLVMGLLLTDTPSQSLNVEEDGTGLELN